MLTGHGSPQGTTERELIAVDRRGPTVELLRSRGPQAIERGVAGRTSRPRGQAQAEVAKQSATALVDDDGTRLDGAVHDSAGVSGGEAAAGLDEALDDGAPRRRSIRDIPVQRGRGDRGHDDEQAPFVDAQAVRCDDVGMSQRGQRLGLSTDPGEIAGCRADLADESQYDLASAVRITRVIFLPIPSG